MRRILVPILAAVTALVPSVPAAASALRRARQAPTITSSPGTKIIAQMILSRLALTQGTLPRI